MKNCLLFPYLILNFLIFSNPSLSQQTFSENKELHLTQLQEFLMSAGEVNKLLQFCVGDDKEIENEFRNIVAIISSGFNAVVRKYETYDILYNENLHLIFDDHVSIINFEEDVLESVDKYDQIKGKVDRKTVCDEIFWIQLLKFEENSREIINEIQNSNLDGQISFDLINSWYDGWFNLREKPQFEKKVMDWRDVSNKYHNKLNKLFENNPYKQISLYQKEYLLEVYKVKAGDNLSKIAKKFQISLNNLIEVNPKITFKNMDLLYPGQAILIPNK